MSTTRRRLRIDVECETISDFIETYGPMWDGDTLLVPAPLVLPAGTEWRFAICSPSGACFLEGRCAIISIYFDVDGSSRDGTMRLELLELLPDCELVFAQLTNVWCEWYDAEGDASGRFPVLPSGQFFVDDCVPRPVEDDATVPNEDYGPRATQPMWRLA